MLTHETICNAVKQVADEFALTKVAYFGSYADGRATEESDLDLLVEFATPSVCVWKLTGLRIALEDILNIAVDVIHAPLPKKSHITITNNVLAYERKG